MLLELKGTASEATDFLVQVYSSWLKHAQSIGLSIFKPAKMSESPTAVERYDALRGFYEGRSEVQILRESLGLEDDPSAEIPEIARLLVPHTRIICIDTECHSTNTDALTEFGLAQISYKQAHAARGNLTPHGRELLEQLQFLHFRIVEHAHLKAKPPGPEGNKYGHTTWVTFQELRAILDGLIKKPIDDKKHPELNQSMAPIILVGHALKNDLDNTKKPGLDYDLRTQPNIVAIVDTQPLARKAGVYRPPANQPTAEVGLKVLTKALGFEHELRNPHTACNDASRTVISAIYMVLSKEHKSTEKMTMQEIVDHLEARSLMQKSYFGTAKCCASCGGRDHTEKECSKDLSCKACKRFDPENNKSSGPRNHSDTFCPHVAEWKSWVRRFKSADKKHKGVLEKMPAEVKGGPKEFAHPWSNWPQSLSWPYRSPFKAVEDHDRINSDPRYREPPAEVENIQSALGPFPVPSEGNWRMNDGSFKIQTAPVVTTTSTVSTASVTQALAASTISSAPATAPPVASTTVIRGTGSGQATGRGRGTERGRGTGSGPGPVQGPVHGRGTIGHGRGTSGRGQGTAPGSSSADDSQSHKTHGAG